MANSVISTRCPAICRLLLLAAVAARATAFAPDDDVIRFDNRSLIINGERKLLLSGGVHYARVLPAQWPRVFALVKEMGLNTVQTYFMWNIHEHKRGNLTWEGRADLSAFIRQAGEAGLYVNLRIGPYICGEYYFGGIPVWMRSVDDVQCFRCADPVWEREMGRIVGEVVEEVRPLLASNGGPVIMLQVENEFSGDEVYLRWAVEMANKLTVGSSVPWILCHDHKQCADMNRDPASGKYDFQALCTINGFWMDEYDSNPGQPSPKWSEDQLANNPGQPVIWTEDQGWFDQWGVAKRVRKSSDQLYGVARFMAYGGAYHNHYMLTGGNNYGLQSGGEVTTAYAPDTAIDYMLLRHQPRYDYYSAFYQTLANVSSELLAYPVTYGTTLDSNSTNHSSASIKTDLSHCSDDDPAHPGSLDDTQQWTWAAADPGTASPSPIRNKHDPGMCVDALASKLPIVLTPCKAGQASQLWTRTALGQVMSVATGPCLKPGNKGKQCHRCFDDGSGDGTKLQLWDCKAAGDSFLGNQVFSYDEAERGIRCNASKLCVTAEAAGGAGAVELHEYGSVAFISNTDHTQVLAVTYGSRQYVLQNHSVVIVNKTTGHVLYNTGMAVDPPIDEQKGVEAHRQTLALQTTSWRWYQEKPCVGARREDTEGPHEQLNFTDNDSDYMWYNTTLPAGVDPAGALKMPKGSGTILYSNVDRESRQLQVLSCAMGLSNGGVGPKSVKGIVGEVTIGGTSLARQTWTQQWFMPGEAKQIFTSSGADSVKWSPATKASNNQSLSWFQATFDLPTALGDEPPQTAYSLDLSSMWKGQAWVNGFNIGRYFLTPGQCSGACAPPIKSGHCYMHWKDCGKPTQTMYHVPTSILKQTGNLVTLFEETVPPAGTTRDVSGVSMKILHEHV